MFLQQYFPIPVLYTITRYCTAWVLLHRPWGYAISFSPGQHNHWLHAKAFKVSEQSSLNFQESMKDDHVA